MEKIIELKILAKVILAISAIFVLTGFFFKVPVMYVISGFGLISYDFVNTKAEGKNWL